MGSSYSNLTLRGPERDRIVSALRARGRDAFVGPAENGCVVVFDEASENDPSAVAALAAELTGELGGVALGLTVHDEDIVYLSLARDGRVLDEYDSCPGYFSGDEAPPTGGDAALLCEAFCVPGARERVEEILRAPAKEGDYFYETARHADLAEALGLPEHAVSLGYEYVYQGEAEDLESELTPVGAATATSEDRDVDELERERLRRTDPDAAAWLDAMRAAQQHPAHGYFRALAAGDVTALRALFAGGPALDDPLSGRVEGEAALAAHVTAIGGYFAGATAHYAPSGLIEAAERVVATGQVVLAKRGSVVTLPVASVWDRAGAGGFTACRAYYSLGVLTGKRGERPPVLDPADGAPLPDVITRHLQALAADDVAALIATYDRTCLSPLGLPFFDPEDTVRRHYGAMLGQDGSVVLQPCTVTADEASCAVEYVATRWDGSDVPAQAGLALYKLREGRICQVQVYADLAPEPEGMDSQAGFGFEGIGSLMSGLTGGVPGGGAPLDMAQLQQMMEGVQQMLSEQIGRPGGASALFESLGQLGGLGGAGGFGDLLAGLQGLEDDDDDEEEEENEDGDAAEEDGPH
jgi:hypothetical protein